MKLYRRFVADRTVWTHLIVVSAPSLAFCARFVEAQEPVGVQAFGPELAVEAFDEGVVGRLARPGEVERDALHVRPQIKLLAHKLRSVVDTNRLRVAKLFRATFQRLDHIFATIAPAQTDGRRQSRERIDIVSVRIFVPSKSWSCTKSIAQMSFAAVAMVRSDRSFAFTLRLGALFRNCRPISQYSRQTRFGFTVQPSRRNNT